MGTIFNIQRFSLYDGPGIRTVVFFKGCPLRCAWCHNPEGLSFKPQVLYNASKCIGCMDCTHICNAGCHVQSEEQHHFRRSSCTDCGACVQACYSHALTTVGQEISAQDIMQQVLRDQAFYSETGGGITLSGGEPLAQTDFAIELLQLAKEAELNTCVETCGYVNTEKLLETAKYTDLFLYDYKITDDTLHRKFCGVSNAPILKNLTVLDDFGASVILRCPIIPGYNDQSDHIQGIAEIAGQHNCIEQIHLEPYHRLGVNKATQLGFAAPQDIAPPDGAIMEYYRSTIETISRKRTYISE